MRPLTEEETQIVERTEKLPDTAAIPVKIVALMLGVSERTIRRRSSPVRIFPLSAGKNGANLGEVRRAARGELSAAS